ncbi:kinase-like protein [Rhizopogon salebrosus TDB-379]|nr:kinase-like protein [Rhizopogon salebrosus TDB-379]
MSLEKHIIHHMSPFSCNSNMILSRCPLRKQNRIPIYHWLPLKKCCETSRNTSARPESFPMPGARSVIYGNVSFKLIRDRSLSVAVKSLLVYTSDEVDGMMKKKSERILRELKTCARLNHPNILSVHGYTTDFGPFVAIVSPWAGNGNLTVYLEKEDVNLLIIRRFQILRDIVAGLRYLHAEDVIHGDLTGMNVLIHDDGTACIADFGLSLLSPELMGINQGSSTLATHGNIRWLAPELLGLQKNDLHARPNKCSDIYSFGGVILQVLTSRIPYYYHRTDTAVILSMYNGEKPDRSRYPTFSSKYWDLIDECRSVAPHDRPSVESVAEEIRNELNSLSSSSVTS